MASLFLAFAALKTGHDLFFYGFISSSAIIGYILAAQSLFFGVVLDVIHFLNFRKRETFANEVK